MLSTLLVGSKKATKTGVKEISLLDFCIMIFCFDSTTHKNLANFSQKSMAETRFIDLSIHIGKPYLYCHQGDCEHIMVFTDVRSCVRRFVLFSLVNYFNVQDDTKVIFDPFCRAFLLLFELLFRDDPQCANAFPLHIFQSRIR